MTKRMQSSRVSLYVCLYLNLIYSSLQVSDAGVDTLIPLSLQGKDNPILQQLLPTLLNPAVLGELEPSVCHCHDCYQC